MRLFRKSLTASSMVVRTRDGRDITNQANLISIHPWQQEAWELYDSCGELWYAANYVARALSRVRLVAQEFTGYSSDGLPQHSPTSNALASTLVENLRSKRYGQSGLMKQMGLNNFVAGEFFLMEVVGEGGNNYMEALSVLEMRFPNGEVQSAQRRTSVRGTYIPLVGVNGTRPTITRIWNPDPRYSLDPDASTKAAIPYCRKLVRLNEVDEAMLNNRLIANGILLIPEEMIPPGQRTQQAAGEHGNLSQAPKFVRDIITAGLAPIKEKDTVSAVFPTVAIGPGDWLAKVTHLTFDRDALPAMEELRASTISHTARILDLPSSALEGYGNVSHWGMWLMKESEVNNHVAPHLVQLVDALTDRYLRPRLLASDAQNVEKYRIWFDLSELLANSDKFPIASELHSRFIITDEALMHAGGMSDNDKLDQTGPEYASRVERLTMTRASRAEGPGGPGTPRPTITSDQPNKASTNPEKEIKTVPDKAKQPESLRR